MQLSCFSKHVAEAYTKHLASGGDALAWSADMKASLSQYIYSGVRVQLLT